MYLLFSCKVRLRHHRERASQSLEVISFIYSFASLDLILGRCEISLHWSVPVFVTMVGGDFRLPRLPLPRRHHHRQAAGASNRHVRLHFLLLPVRLGMHGLQLLHLLLQLRVLLFEVGSCVPQMNRLPHPRLPVRPLQVCQRTLDHLHQSSLDVLRQALDFTDVATTILALHRQDEQQLSDMHQRVVVVVCSRRRRIVQVVVRRVDPVVN